MFRCIHCNRVSPFLSSDPQSLCRKCRLALCSEAEAERERVKADLLSARFLKDHGRRIEHLQRALDRTRRLFRYERLGCLQPNPSPKALKGFLVKKLREAESLLHAEHDRMDSTAGLREGNGAPGQARPLLPAASPREHNGGPSMAPVNGNAASAGTRQGRRHSAMMQVLMDYTTPAMTEDISSKGLCVRTARIMKPGSRVGVMLKAPHGHVSGEGMVRWAHRKQDADDGSQQVVMGVEFLVPPPELQRFG